MTGGSALFAPLRGLCPTPARAGEIVELPYDVMTRSEAIEMATGRPWSFLHVSRPDIDLPEGAPAEEGHALAAAALARLVEGGLLQRDTQTRFHVYRMSDQEHVQVGVIGAASIPAYESGRIRRHELTRPDKQADRARQIEAVNAQTGPVYLVHRPDAVVAQVTADVTAGPPRTAVVGPGGVRHEVWPIEDPTVTDRLVAAFDAMPALYIADGHHRSAAAAAVHARRGTASSQRFLGVAFPTDEVRILPYNRLVLGREGVTGAVLVNALAARFPLEPASEPVLPHHPGLVGVYTDSGWFTLDLPETLGKPETLDLPETLGKPESAEGEAVSRLDVARLQEHVLEPVLGIGDPRTDPRIGFAGGVRGPSELEAAVDSGRWTAAFTMYPTSIDQLLAVADAGGIMPPKSTWFEPKLLDGLVSLVLD